MWYAVKPLHQRLFFLKKALVECSEKNGKAGWQDFSAASFFGAGVQRDAIPLCWVQGRSAPVGVKGQSPLAG